MAHGIDAELEARRDRPGDDLEALLDLIPDFNVVLTGVGVIAKRTGGLDFVADGPGTINWVEVHFREQLIYNRELNPTSVAGGGDTITLQGEGCAQIAKALYDAIERGALLNDRVE